MFTVSQSGVYANGSKFKADCYDDVCPTYVSTSMRVLVYTERRITFPEGGKYRTRSWIFGPLPTRLSRCSSSSVFTFVLSLPPADSQAVFPDRSERVHTSQTLTANQVATCAAVRPVKPV